jgi:hypothetical protein
MRHHFELVSAFRPGDDLLIVADAGPVYSRASKMLQPSVYPETSRKAEHLQTQSQHNFRKVPLTTFSQEDRNSVGVKIRKNTGSGNESTGLNDGSKNSVATTYLADAWNWGAEIFCGCKVQFVEKDPSGKGYVIYFARYGNGSEGFTDEFKHQLFWVKAVSSSSFDKIW